MIVLASRNGRIGLPAAIEAMSQGGSAVDAVEAGTRVVERNPEDPTVGLGGLPNVLGEVRLDASIMDGSSRVTPGSCPPGVPTDPYVRTLAHTVPQIMSSLRERRLSAPPEAEAKDSAPLTVGSAPSA